MSETRVHEYESVRYDMSMHLPIVTLNTWGHWSRLRCRSLSAFDVFYSDSAMTWWEDVASHNRRLTGQELNGSILEVRRAAQGGWWRFKQVFERANFGKEVDIDKGKQSGRRTAGFVCTMSEKASPLARSMPARKDNKR